MIIYLRAGKTYRIGQVCDRSPVVRHYPSEAVKPFERLARLNAESRGAKFTYRFEVTFGIMSWQGSMGVETTFEEFFVSNLGMVHARNTAGDDGHPFLKK